MDETKETKQNTSPQGETPQEEPSAEVSGTTPKEETKTYSEEEVTRQINAALTAKGREAKKLTNWADSLANQEKELQERSSKIEIQEQERRQREIASLADDPDAQSRLKKAHQLEDDNRKAEEELKRKNEGLTKKWNQAIDLAVKYNIHDAMDELMDTVTPREMELLAKDKAAEKKEVQPKTPESKSGGETFTPDSGKSDAGGDDDAHFQKQWNEGNIPATPENTARIQKILNK